MVGLGLSLPGASTLEEFWANIVEGRRFFQPATTMDWGADPEGFFQPGGPAVDKAYSLNGVFNPRRTIDPEGLNLPEGFDLKSADGSLAFWLKAGRDAARDAKLDKVPPAKIGVISGHVILPSTAMAEAAASLYLKEATRNWPERPEVEPAPQNAFNLMGYSARLLAGALGFSGSAFTIDAACASSLYAIDLASAELLSGRLEAVITGGVAKADALFTQLGFSQLRALSTSGYLSPFDQSADGLVVGEGAVALTLKRLDVALAHGDKIRAVIRGVGLSNDQSGNILAPQAEGQLRAMRAAWKAAGLSPARVQLIEAHGTGTILGDRVEISALKEFLADSSFDVPERPAEAPVVVSSVKSNIGHLLSAAGAASMAKVVLALEHKTLPPTAGFKTEAPGLNLSDAPALRVLAKAEAWPAPADGGPRLAAVNSFGFGGVNAQIIVEEFIPELWAKGEPSRPPAIRKSAEKSIRLLSARALSAPWPDFASLAQNWMESEGPPIISTRRYGSLRATGLFFNSLVLEGAGLRLAPKDLAHILPQQALALKMAEEALSSAKLESAHGLPAIVAQGAKAGTTGVDKSRVGVFMGVDIDPRSADYAFRWLGPIRAAEFLVRSGHLLARDLPEFVEELRRHSHPHLTASRVVGALGSLVASRVARYIGSGGPAFTVTDGQVPGLRALRLGIEAIRCGQVDLALAGVVDTMGDPKTAAMEPGRLWEEGAAMLTVASEEAAEALGRGDAPLLAETIDPGGRLGGLGGLFPLVKNAFFISHRLASRGLGAGVAYWIKNKTEAPRRLESSGFAITERGGEDVSSPPYSYEDATWFLLRGQSHENSLELLNVLESMAQAAANDHTLMEVLGPVRAEKRALKRLGDRFWAEYGNASGARPVLAMLARNFDDLAGLIRKARAKLKGDNQALAPDQKNRIIWALEEERVRGDLAWVFPGSGSHYQGMGRRLAMSFPHLMCKLEDGLPWLADLFQSNVFWTQGYKEISAIQAILGQVSFGLLGAEVLKQFKVQPKAVIGYSLGEATALAATGAWSELKVIYKDLARSDLFTRELAGEHLAARRYFNWPEGRPFKWVMGVVPRPANEIKKALAALPSPHKGRAFLLVVNTPGEGVVGGEEAAVKALSQSLGAVMCQLDGVAAVHNPSIASVTEQYARFHTRATTPPPGLRYYSAAWAKAYTPDAATAARSLTDQALAGHDFPALIERAYADGVRFFVEVGPGAGTSRMINNILKGRSHLASSLSLNAHDEGWLGLHRLLVELWMAGYPLKMSVLYPDASESSLKLPVPITLAPAAELWPQPEDVLPLAERERQQQVQHEKPQTPAAPRYAAVEKSGPAPKPALAPAGEVKKEARAEAAGPAEAPLNKTEDSFEAWMAQNNQARAREAKADLAENPAPLNREQCLAFAVGGIGEVFGPRFSEVDSFPSRVRLPDEPLMLVDRVLSIEGKALSMQGGRIVTEHDVLPGAWYLDQGHIPAGLAIESGQADLMLSAWLGADFVTRGKALYRLLDAEVTFYRQLPRAGETAHYDIRILRFFKYGQTHLFRFEFIGTVDGQPLLSMKGGCAGFFTPAELAGGRGLPGGGLIDEVPEALVDPEAVKFRPQLPGALTQGQLTALRNGNFVPAFGDGFRPRLNNPAPLPSGRMSLIDKVVRMERSGGRYGCGFIRAEMAIDPQAWFLTCHFRGDEVMPGTLMYESCLHALRVFLTAQGWVGEAEEVSWQPVTGVAASLKCRGQVTAATKTVAYEIHIRRLVFSEGEGGQAEPVAEAEAVMLADDRPIVEVRNLNLRLAGSSKSKLEKIWAASSSFRPPLEAAAPGAPQAAKGEIFTKEQLLALAQGRPSSGLGPGYARYDSGAFVARLPRPPYDFIDQATVIRGRKYEIENASEVVARYTPPVGSWLFTEAGGHKPSLPYAALNEIALQPCGFLAAYMGSALLFEGPMYFRNLGGEARVLHPVYGGEEIITTATLTRSSRIGEILIEHYRFSCSARGRVVYEGVTHFGFFSPGALANQGGLTGENAAAWLTRPPALQPYPEGPLWPSGRWRMLDSVGIKPGAGPKAMGSVFAAAKVDPEAWFFKAHFYQDPVCPGSLGLEAFFQAMKALVHNRFDLGGRNVAWLAPLPGQSHQWLYRGQITPAAGEMTISLTAQNFDEYSHSITADGILMVDGLPIYKMSGFTVGWAPEVSAWVGKQAKSSFKEPGPALSNISPEQLLNWRREKGFSQGQLARIMGVTPIYISLMERGKRNISPLMAEKLSLIFSGEPSGPDDISGLDSELLAKGSLKSRREEKEAASRLLTPEKLRELRTAKGISQKKLADQVGVTATLIGLIELGKRSLSLSLAHKLMAALEEE